jgi:curved DNA-binding protein CbpA
MNPYLVLGLPPDADDQRIRQAYLDAVKAAPPDHEPERFQAVSQAYEAIKDADRSIKHRLFTQTSAAASPMDAFLDFARLEAPRRPPAFETLKTFLRDCARR